VVKGRWCGFGVPVGLALASRSVRAMELIDGTGRGRSLWKKSPLVTVSTLDPSWFLRCRARIGRVSTSLFEVVEVEAAAPFYSVARLKWMYVCRVSRTEN
jgi:hypothetical protein